MLALYGHPFSSYTWKALIPLYACGIPFAFREVGPDQPENSAVIQAGSPQGKFPLLEDGGARIFEATSIIEYLAANRPEARGLIPTDPQAALRVRQMDRVFDNYVMHIVQMAVNEYLRNPENPDQVRVEEARAMLSRSYRWLEGWLADYPADGHISLIECAASPSLFYADWVQRIDDEFPRLTAWRSHLLALPAVKRCVDEARPYRPWFPLGAPDRD
jgi:glutathione S-transferase